MKHLDLRECAERGENERRHGKLSSQFKQKSSFNNEVDFNEGDDINETIVGREVVSFASDRTCPMPPNIRAENLKKTKFENVEIAKSEAGSETLSCDDNVDSNQKPDIAITLSDMQGLYNLRKNHSATLLGGKSVCKAHYQNVDLFADEIDDSMEALFKNELKNQIRNTKHSNTQHRHQKSLQLLPSQMDLFSLTPPVEIGTENQTDSAALEQIEAKKKFL